MMYRKPTQRINGVDNVMMVTYAGLQWYRHYKPGSLHSLLVVRQGLWKLVEARVAVIS